MYALKTRGEPEIFPGSVDECAEIFVHFCSALMDPSLLLVVLDFVCEIALSSYVSKQEVHAVRNSSTKWNGRLYFDTNNVKLRRHADKALQTVLLNRPGSSKSHFRIKETHQRTSVAMIF